MTDTIRITIDPDVPEDERDTLLLRLREHADVRQAQHGDPLSVALIVIAVLKDLSTLAGGAVAIITLIEKLKAWRRAAREHGIVPKVTLERPGRPPLDLASANDSTIEGWFEG